MGFLTKLRCPNCRAVVHRAGLENKPWCGDCGWNRSAVAERLTLDIRENSYFFLGGTGLGIILCIAFQPSFEVISGFAVIFAGMAAFLWLPPYLNLRKIRKTYQLVPEDSADTDAADQEASQLERVLAQIPTPRPLRMTRLTKLKFLFFAAMEGLIAWLYASESSRASLGNEPPPLWIILVAVLFLVWPILSFAFAWKRDRPVLADGNVAVGRVLSQRATGKYNTGSEIQYIFYPPTFAPGIVARCADRSHALFEGMPVLVFYDSGDPESNVAHGCSLFEIDAKRGSH